MQVIKTIKEMQAFADNKRKEGKTIALVPTMGFLHDGHKSLLKQGRRYDCLIMSIFVNPIQFGQNEDYNLYPRDFKRDLKIAEDEHVDIVFYPDTNEMYPHGFETFVSVPKISKHLCGISRPSHFQGVATVVAKLFNIVKPHIAIFGEKDYQQLVIIKKMTRDMNFDIEIIGMPIVRGKDGLAISSRNSYLDTREKKASLCIYRAIVKARDMFASGIRSAEDILKELIKIIEKEPLARIEYIKICDIDTLEDIVHIEDKAIVAIAAWLGRARLIDNCVLGG
ncbi:MAG: pantoate--beta-alanine ligase [Deltaproteobacteria bacterium]|nr:pantoate--beta-alanine ligase [Deltaproteobacteria bacterium]